LSLNQFVDLTAGKPVDSAWRSKAIRHPLQAWAEPDYNEGETQQDQTKISVDLGSSSKRFPHGCGK